MKKSQRFTTLAELAKNKEQQAAIALGTSNRIHSDNIKKLESLKRYRLEYLNRFKLEGQSGMDVLSMQTYNNFIENIEQAINNQKLQIIESEQRCKESQKHWQAVHSKTEIMNITVERYKNTELKEDERLEQKETDDRPHKTQSISE